MTEQPLTEPGKEAAEALTYQAAASLRAHMNTALANLNDDRGLLANLAAAGLIPLPKPTEQLNLPASG